MRVKLQVEMGEVQISGADRSEERPDAAWVVGACPLCGEPVVSNAYHVGGHPGGYVLRRECWASIGERPTCDFRRVL